jgi:DNA repair protein RadC
LKNKPITQWAMDDRPREKLLNKGPVVLSDAELIGILLATGTKSKSAVDLGREIMESADADLNKLARMSVKELCKINGIGPAKAITIVAAVELGGRKKTVHSQNKTITGSLDVYNYIGPKLEDKQYEEFWAILLSRSNKIIKSVQISEGGISGTVVDPKKIFRFAIEESASGVILCHNHPSGNLKASQQDLDITRKLVKAGEALEIKVLDHLIVSNEGYLSFKDEGLI